MGKLKERKILIRLVVVMLAVVMVVMYMPALHADSDTTITFERDGFTYELDSSAKTAKLTKIDPAKTGEVKIPEKVTDDGGVSYDVTAMDLISWQNKCDQITKIDIPETVTDMGESNFREFGSLLELTVPEVLKFLVEASNVAKNLRP